MSKRYEKQGEDSAIQVYLRDVRATYHERLSEVTFDVLTVCEYDEESGEELRCLTLHGYPAAATVKIMSHERRAQGSADVLLTIDAIAWHELSAAERVALLDHELTHVLILEKDGAVVRDDLRRPKLKLRLHDVEIGGFLEVMDRHREAALEVMAVRACVRAGGQYYWDFDGVPTEPKRVPTSVRIESGGQSVTLTPEHREQLQAAAQRMRGEARP